MHKSILKKARKKGINELEEEKKEGSPPTTSNDLPHEIEAITLNKMEEQKGKEQKKKKKKYKRADRLNSDNDMKTARGDPVSDKEEEEYEIEVPEIPEEFTKDKNVIIPMVIKMQKIKGNFPLFRTFRK